MANIIELIARLKDEASGGLEKLGVSLRKVADVGLEPIARISPTAANALGGLLDKAGPTGLAVAAIGGAALGAVAGITHLVKGVADVGDRLHDMEIKTGASVEALQALGHAASKSGGSLEDVVASFRFLQKAITEAGEGNDQAIRGFEKLGLNLAELKQLSPEEQFATLAKAINDISDPAARATAAVDVFGRAGAALLPTLKEVAERGLDQLVESAKRLGIVLSSETAAKADEFNDTLADINAVARGLVLSLGAELLPTFVELAKGIAAAAQGLTTFLRETNAVAITVGAIKLAIAPVAEAMNLLVTAGLAAAKVLSGDFSGAAAVLAAGANNMGEAFSGAFAGISKGSAEAAGSVKTFGDTAKQAADQTIKLSEKQIQVIASVADAAKKAAQDREAAEVTASGNVLKQIENDLGRQKAAIEDAKAKQLQAIEQIASTGIDKAALRAQAERTQLDAIVAAEIDAANKRKAAIAGFVAEALGFIKSLGPGLDDLQKKLELAEALTKATAGLQALGQSGVASSRDLSDAIGKVKDQLSGLGATGAQIGATVPENIRAIADSFDAVANKAALIDGVFTNVVADVQQLTGAVQQLDDELTGHSLDDSFVEVAAATDQSRQSFGDYGDAALEVIQHIHDMDRETKIWGDALSNTQRSLDDTGNAVSDLVGKMRPGIGIHEELNKKVQELKGGLQGVADGARGAGGALGDMGNIGASVAAIMNTLVFSGKSFQEISEHSIAAAKELIGQLTDAQIKIERIRAGVGGSGAFAGVGSLAQPLFIGAERLEQAGRQVGDDIFAAARALRSAQPFSPQVFQGGGIVQGPPGRHVPILAEEGELIIPKKFVDRIMRRRSGRFQEGGIVSSGGTGGVVLHVNFNGTTIADARGMDKISKDLHKTIQDFKRRGIL